MAEKGSLLQAIPQLEGDPYVITTRNPLIYDEKPAHQSRQPRKTMAPHLQSRQAR
jgi:hypothetical protein